VFRPPRERLAATSMLVSPRMPNSAKGAVASFTT
jgi:hypothetical protein